MEKIGFENVLAKTWKPFQIGYTMLAVIFAWVLFRSGSFGYAFGFWKAMFRFSIPENELGNFMNYFNLEFIFYLIIGIAGALGFFKYVSTHLKPILLRKSILNITINTVYPVVLASMLFICTLYLISGTYNPFIYFRF